VDAKGNTDTAPGDTLDDVVFTAEGRIGLGTLHPQTRLDIRGSVRMADGTEGLDKILVSDADGSAHWEPPNWYSELSGGYNSTGATTITFTAQDIFPAGMGSIDLTTGTITVPHTGIYRLTLHGTAYNTRTSDAWFYPIILLSAGSSTTTFHHPQMMRSLGALDFGCVYLYSLAAGEKLKLSLRTSYSFDANQYTDTSLLVEYVK
jgi:hypothetical protein